MTTPDGPSLLDQEISRRRFGKLTTGVIGTAGLGALLAACSSPSGAASSAAAGTPRRGGTLVFGAGEPPSGHWDPQQNFGTTDLQVDSLVFDSLVAYDAQGKIHPSLATSWKQLDDRHMRLTLRQGVHWHDGTPFTAEDVKATIERVANNASVDQHIFWAPAKVQINDPGTITIATAEPFAPLLKVLAVTSIVSAAQLRDESALNKHPIGTGYFKFGSYNGNVVELVANKSYWAGPPHLDGVNFQIISDDGAKMSALAAGQIDITYRLSPADLRFVKSSPDVKITAFPSLDNIWMGFDCSKAPLNDVRVRQAIAHAIDRPSIIKLFAGYAKLPNSPLPIGAPGYTPLTQYNYDVAQAKAMLGAAGVKSGQTLTYPLSTGVWPYQEQVDQINVSGLKAVGFKVQTKQLDTGTFLANYTEYDVFVQSWYMLTGDPDFSFSIYAPPLGTAIFKWHPSQFTRLFDAERQTIDPAARQQKINDLSEYLWQQLPLLPLHNPQWIVAYRTNVHGYQHGPTFAELLHNVWLG